MDVEQTREFLRHNHRAVLATRRADGSTHLVPIVIGVDEEGRGIVSTAEASAKARNLKTDPRAAACVMTDRFYGRWVTIEGTASILSLPEAMEPLVDYYRRVAGKDHPDWDEYREAMRREGRCLIRIEIERVVPS